MNDWGKICWVVDLGLVRYAPALELQRRVVSARKAGAVPDVLLFCEHPHVITLGRNGKNENLRASAHLLRQMNCEFHTTDRGGDVTYHGPGQVVGYPILDLTRQRRDVAWYVDQLEEVMIRATADFGVSAYRVEGMHGVWVDSAGRDGNSAEFSRDESREGAQNGSAPVEARADFRSEKLAALGVHLSRWVTSHGFAYNVSTDLRYFELIVPCGLAGKRATSLETVLGRGVPLAEVKEALMRHFGGVFGCELRTAARGELEEALSESPAAAPA
jgi:lipoyl(octanoyl) transferase